MADRRYGDTGRGENVVNPLDRAGSDTGQRTKADPGVNVGN